MKSNNPTAGKKSSKPAESASRMVELWAAPGIVALSTFLVFLAALDNGFVDWDDDKTITENPHFRGLGQGNTDEAVGHLRRALQLEPEFAEAHESLGRLLVRLGKRDEAIHHFEEAVRIVRSRPAVQPLP